MQELPYMISVEEALELINNHTSSLAPRLVPLKEAAGLVLAEDIFAPIDLPSFSQSNMDGYAIAFEEGKLSYEVVGTIAAGDAIPTILERGKAARIFTGAPVPAGADTVVMQEKTELIGAILHIKDLSLTVGTNVRTQGTEIRKGTKAIPENTMLQPIVVGFLAGLGIANVSVYPKPRVGILVTGNELQEPGAELAFGKVYESNSYSLRVALEQLHINQIIISKSGDHIDSLSKELSGLLDQSDLVLMVGGVSVGDFDFTFQAFRNCAAEPIFHKIRQKPGKPLLFGKKEKKVLFGLPGNPSSVMTCFYEYVLPAIGQLMHTNSKLRSIQTTVAQDFQKPAGLHFFGKAIYDGETVKLEQGQESFRLASFARSNCLISIPENQTKIKAGDIVTIHLLPQYL